MKKSKRLLIIGANGHGRVVADIALKMNVWDEIAFLDDDEEIKSPNSIKIIGKSSEYLKHIGDYEFFVAIGDNKTREKIQHQLETVNANIPIIIDPSACIGQYVDIGAGSVVMAGVVINCSTKIGRGCIINTGATIDHDNIIGDYVHISPGVHTAGTVVIGKGTWLGIGSVVSNNLNITCSCTIGAGAVVVRDITCTGIYIGVPARRIKNGEDLDSGK